MLDAVIEVLRAVPEIGYALVFGSTARGTQHAHSDLDLAIGGLGRSLTALELGDLIGRLEAAAGREVDLVLLDEAPVGLAYRVFRDGKVVLERDPAVLAERKGRAVAEYFDFRPIEDLFARARASGGADGR